MYRFFVEENQLNNGPVKISGADYNHIKNVLRLKKGEKILLSNGNSREYQCVIEDYDLKQDCVILSIVDIFGSTRELPARITLFQGYPKGDKLEMIVQKAVELGAYEIVPVMMKRCVVKLDERKAVKKVERLNSISQSAAKQAKRGMIPEVKGVMTLKEACQYAKSMDFLLLPYENAEGMEYSKEVIKQAGTGKNIGVFIGPEGGFESSEVEMIEKAGGKTISLGHRILRTETAGITILSLLMFQIEGD